MILVVIDHFCTASSSGGWLQGPNFEVSVSKSLNFLVCPLAGLPPTIMEANTSLEKHTMVSPTALDALTTVTPDNGSPGVGRDHHQLSDDAADAPQPCSEGPVAVETLRSPFADADGLDMDNHSDVVSSGEGSPVDGLGPHSSMDMSRQHHLLRHSLPSELRGSNVLSHFGVETVSDAAKTIKKMSQRDLQAKFKAVYGTRTFSNNNNWLRRKLFEGEFRAVPEEFTLDGRALLPFGDDSLVKLHPLFSRCASTFLPCFLCAQPLDWTPARAQ